MNNETEMVATLQKLLDLQERTHAIQRESLELQKTALENQMRAVTNQMAFGRLYKVVLIVGAIIIAGFVILLMSLYF